MNNEKNEITSTTLINNQSSPNINKIADNIEELNSVKLMKEISKNEIIFDPLHNSKSK